MQLTFIVGCYDENIKILHTIFYDRSVKLIETLLLYLRNLCIDALLKEEL